MRQPEILGVAWVVQLWSGDNGRGWFDYIWGEEWTEEEARAQLKKEREDYHKKVRLVKVTAEVVEA
jgi:hypothetical protein